MAALAVGLVWAALLAGMLGRRGWFLDLFSHFRIHYAALFVVLACLLLWLRRPALAMAAALGLALSIAPAIVYMQAPSATDISATEPFRLVSLNVWYRNEDLTGIAAFLEQTRADAIVLQEVSRPQARALSDLLPSYPHTHVDPDWRGAAVYSRWPLTATQWNSLADGASRAAYVHIDWRGSRIALLGVHLHWPIVAHEARLQQEQLARLGVLARSEREPLLVAGDFNLTPWSPRFRDLLAASALEDCARGRGLDPSWPSYTAWLGIRIDHCLASSHWRVLDVRVGAHVGSDHRPIIADLALTTATKPPAASY
jgi:endonuclease/exonuclease/phosphatase (EEP) superfamily protein YafD